MKKLAVSAIFVLSIGILSGSSVHAQTFVCPLIKTPMKRGWNNDAAQVTALQTFLKVSEGLNVNVSGNFDEQTENAVKTFQKKYADAILTPWGATKASGVVLLTTMKKINQLFCGQPMTLNSAEVETIKNYQAKNNPVMTVAAVVSTSTSNDSAMPVTVTTSVETAPDRSASLGSKLWYFVKNIF